MMKITVAKPEEFSQIIELFRQYNFGLVKKRWFEWKHLENPIGESIIFKLLNNSNLDGTVAVTQQIFRQRGCEFVVMQAVDGLLGRSLRGKGFFNEVMGFLARLPFRENNKPVFRMGFASLPSSMKALENSGWKKMSRFRLYKAILNTSALVSLPCNATLSILLHPLLGIYRACLCRGHGKIAVREITRFTEDMSRFQPQDRIAGDRSAEYLNWRVIDNPREALHAFGFYHHEELVGYVICKELSNSWEVLEFRTSQPGRLAMASFLKYINTQQLTGMVDFWLMEGFEQFDKLPIGLLKRGGSGAMFVSGHREIGLSDNNICWAASYLDSDW